MSPADTRVDKGRGRQRTSRWGPKSQTSNATSLDTAITAAMTAEQLVALVMHFRIEETSQSLQTNDFDRANPHTRSPSPHLNTMPLAAGQTPAGEGTVSAWRSARG